MDRDNFIDKELQYLFSFDAPLSGGREGFDWGHLPRGPEALDNGTTSAARVHRYGDDARGDAPVYNALGGEREQGVCGKFAILQERVTYPWGHDYGELAGRYVIETDDGQFIEAEYSGTFSAGADWHWLRHPFVPARRPSPFELVRAKAYICARHDTPSIKYRWLTQLLCVAYGRLDLIAGLPLGMTFDVYGTNSSSPRQAPGSLDNKRSG